MTIDELITRLQEAREDLGGDAEVRLMTQKNWPFENDIRGVASSWEIREHCFDGEADETDDAILYIVEGEQLCYGDQAAWDVCY